MFDLSKPIEGESSGKQFAPIPEGAYPVKVVKCDWKLSKTGNEYLEIQLQLFGCEFERRMVFHRLNLLHESEKVRNYALADIKRMLGASNIETKGLSAVDKKGLEALVYRVQAVCRIAIELGSSGYPDKNVVKGWLPMNLQSPPSIISKPITVDDIPF
jgi:hypothetical protein